MRIASLIAIATSLSACGGVLTEAENQFQVGHYPAAKQSFAVLEARNPTWDDATRAEYALYRGLTYEGLGDRARARFWLHRAKVLDDTRPGTLRPQDVSRLRIALDSLEPP